MTHKRSILETLEAIAHTIKATKDELKKAPINPVFLIQKEKEKADLHDSLFKLITAQFQEYETWIKRIGGG